MIRQLSQRLLGPVTLVLLALTIWLGVWVTPPDKVQGNLARLLYVHPAIAWVALYVSFGTATIASALYLWRRTRSMGGGPRGALRHGGERRLHHPHA